MWLGLAVLTALLASGQDVIGKRTTGRVGPYVTAWAWMAFSVPFMLVLLLWQDPVALKSGFWLTLAVGSTLLTISGITLFKAIEAGELSLTLPLLSLTPVFMLFTAPLILGEVPTLKGSAGIFLIVAGCWVLYFDPAAGGWGSAVCRVWKAKSGRLMLLTAFLFSIGGAVDKVGVLRSSPLLWAIMLNTIVAGGIGGVMWQRTPHLGTKIRAEWPALVLMGFLAAMMMFSQMTALTLAPAAYVIAIKRTSILVSSILSFCLFKERLALRRVPAILLMLAGIFVISFSNM